MPSFRKLDWVGVDKALDFNAFNAAVLVVVDPSNKAGDVVVDSDWGVDLWRELVIREKQEFVTDGSGDD